jgi:HAD superfamily hydrolase (TIGR01509 family)
MNKAIFFDLDGVLVDLVNVHHQSLNSALELYGYSAISETSRKTYNGIPTRIKLKYLDIPENDVEKIFNAKQTFTHRDMIEILRPDKDKIELLYYLKMSGYLVACVTNSIRATAELALELSYLDLFMDSIVSNEDAPYPKPHPSPYLCAMEDLVVYSGVAIEDNDNGIWSARDAGLKVIQVAGPQEVNLSLLDRINSL